MNLVLWSRYLQQFGFSETLAVGGICLLRNHALNYIHYSGIYGAPIIVSEDGPILLEMESC